MENLKIAFMNRWIWYALAIIIAFLVYHAPRFTYSLPFI